MTTIKFLTAFRNKVGGERFQYSPDYLFVQDPACRDYDWLVVLDDFPGDFEELACPRAQTILCTWEPVCLKGYSRPFTRQFGHFLSNRPPEAERHPNYRLGRGYFPWFNGRDYTGNASAVIPPKTKLVSAVCSAKQMRHTKHHARYRLVSRLAEAVDGLDWFGLGVRDLDKKYDALDAYKYHVAVENHIGVHHWSEKVADALLCECLPFYAGDPALAEALPEQSFIPIPIDDPDAAVAIVRKAIADGEYERRREAILEAKRLLLTKYNFWAQVIALIEDAKGKPSATAVGIGNRLHSRHGIRAVSLSAKLWDAWIHAKLGLRRFL